MEDRNSPQGKTPKPLSPSAKVREQMQPISGSVFKDLLKRCIYPERHPAGPKRDLKTR